MSETYSIVVVAAGMGGISALGSLLQHLPPNYDGAILVALRFEGQPPNIVLEILQSYSSVPLGYARDGTHLKPRMVFLAPLSHHLLMRAPNVLSLEPGGSGDNLVPSADHLFASAAAVYGRRVVGVVLSGRSHDGTKGLEDIEAAGGVGIVQLPETAGSPEMPSAAIRNDHPNYCLPVPQIAALLARLPLDKGNRSFSS